MTHVGICTQDGPEQKTGEIRLQILHPPPQIQATLLFAGVSCTYSGQLSDFYSGTMNCPGRAVSAEDLAEVRGRANDGQNTRKPGHDVKLNSLRRRRVDHRAHARDPVGREAALARVLRTASSSGAM